MYLPKQKDLREKLLKLVAESVQFHREVETLRDYIKNNSDVAVEEFSITKKEYNNLVKAALDKAKLEDAVEDLQTTIANFEILTGEVAYPEEG